MLVVAITGGLGSGKSEVTKIFGELGAYTLNADDIAREVRETPEVIIEMVRILGEDVIGDDGALIKEKVAAAIFSDPEKKEAIEAVMHPKIFTEMVNRCGRIAEQAPGALVAIEIPLLAEVGWTFNNVVVVTVDEEVAIARAVERGMTEEDARVRRSQQATDQQRMLCGDFAVVIDNTGDRDVLREKVVSARNMLCGLDAPHVPPSNDDGGRSLQREFWSAWL